MTILSRAISGIYEIRNIINGHRYIGSSVDIHVRWNLHKRQLKRGTHHSPYLQRAWNKYNEKAFLFVVLQVIEDKDKRLEREQFFIDKFQPEYNVCKLAISRLGTKHTEETKRKMSIAKKGLSPSVETRKKISNAHKGRIGHWLGKLFSSTTKKRISKSVSRYWLTHDSPCAKKVNQYSKDGIFLRSYMSMGEASRITGIHVAHISRCCYGGRPSAGGFVWRYAEEK